ncbi:hypothetical protein [Nitrobacter winogradskyi]|uniref:Uncharacterized protein n=1 Tax=Nitrobacter winogradskyi TaxID=913 RepID=A0ACC6ALL3_NITWI|nr:hypothetical protein [Nitrobacter winogradskyi]MCP2000289.1 hypothetical protein [Nitrobacter winogradskyi]
MNDTHQDCLKLSKEIGLEWFKVHADQRLKAFNFFLLIAGFCIGGFFTALSVSPLAASTIAFVLGAICICFKYLDRRTATLVKHGEELLSYCLERIGDPEMPNPIRLADECEGTLSYRQIFNTVFLIFGIMSFGGMVFSLVRVFGYKV